MELLVVALLLGLVWLLQSIIYKHFGFSRLEYKSTLSVAEATEGDNIELCEVISNAKILPVPWLKADITLSKWLELSELQSVVTDKSRYVSSFFALRGMQRIRRRWHVKCKKRGVYSIEKTILVSSDILKGIMLSKSVECNSSVVVLPCPIDLNDRFVQANLAMGDFVVRRFIQPDPFYVAGVREYRPEDSLRSIHWAATAKENRFMVYKEEYTVTRSRTVILNMQSHEFESEGAMNEPRLENAIRTCVALFDETLSNGLSLCFMANTPLPVRTEEYWGEEHLHNLLELLARMKLESGEHFPNYLNGIFDTISTTDIAVVSSYLDDALLSFASSKLESGIPISLYILDPFCDVPSGLPFPVHILNEEAKEA